MSGINHFFPEEYAGVVREERNLVAILFHALVSNLQCLTDFLQALPVRLENPSPEAATPQVFLEYAFPRDLWAQHTKKNGRCENERQEDNEEKCRFLLSQGGEELGAVWENQKRASGNWVRSFNGMFGAVSPSHIENPGNWKLASLGENFRNLPDLQKVLCKLKWAFKVQPDLVIAWQDSSGCRAVCVEAKWFSPIGYYSKSQQAAAIWGDERIGQLHIQEYLFTKVLGYSQENVDFVFIAPDKSGGARSCRGTAFNVVSWEEVWRALRVGATLPPYMRVMIERSRPVRSRKARVQQ